MTKKSYMLGTSSIHFKVRSNLEVYIQKSLLLFKMPSLFAWNLTLHILQVISLLRHRHLMNYY